MFTITMSATHRKKAKTTLAMITTTVVAMTSLRGGNVTFFSSERVSVKKVVTLFQLSAIATVFNHFRT